MAETNGLLNRRTGKSGTEGSNPSVSAIPYAARKDLTIRGYKVRILDWQDEDLGLALFGEVAVPVWGSFGSGLAKRPGDPEGIVWAVGDRGPNLKPKTLVRRHGIEGMAALAEVRGAKVMPRPDLGPSIARLRVLEDRVELLEVVRIRGASGEAVSGLPPPSSAHAEAEPVFDGAGCPLAADASGLDTEGIAALRDGTFMVGDEFGPSLVHIRPDGRVAARYVPEGSDFGDASYPVRAVLPRIAATRELNRGFEAVTLSPDERSLFLAFQSPLAHPDESAHEQARHVRVWRLDPDSLAVTAQYLYPLDAPATFVRDNRVGSVGWSDLKVSELVAISDDELLVLERGSHTTKIYRVILSPERELAAAHLDIMTRPTVEELSAAGEALPALAKELIISSDDAPELPADLEGLAVLSPTELLLVNDNDFGVEGARTVFARVTFDQPVLAPRRGSI